MYIADGDLSVGTILGGLLYLVGIAVIGGSVYSVNISAGATSDSAYLLAFGDISLMNFWMALLPSSKTGVFSRLVGIPFERRIRYHKGIVLLAMASGLGHVLLAWKIKTDIFYSTEAVGSKPVIPLYGLIAYILFSSMTLLALEPVRRLSYELFNVFHLLYIPAIAFLILHVNGAIVGFIPGLVLHGTVVVVYIVYSLSLIVYDSGIDIYIRIVASVYAKPSEEVSVEGDLVKLRIDGSTGSMRYSILPIQQVIPNHDEDTSAAGTSICKPFPAIGQYFFINIPEVSWVEWHPFSVSSVDIDGSITFCIKSMGPRTWTNKLAAKAQAANAKNMRLTVAAEGPYGGLSLDVHLYRSLLLVAGGIGITALLPILSYLHRANSQRLGKLTLCLYKYMFCYPS